MLLLLLLVAVFRLEDGEFVVEAESHVVAGRRGAHVNVQNPRIQGVRRHIFLIPRDRLQKNSFLPRRAVREVYGFSHSYTSLYAIRW